MTVTISELYRFACNTCGTCRVTEGELPARWCEIVATWRDEDAERPALRAELHYCPTCGPVVRANLGNEASE